MLNRTIQDVIQEIRNLKLNELIRYRNQNNDKQPGTYEFPNNFEQLLENIQEAVESVIGESKAATSKEDYVEADPVADKKGSYSGDETIPKIINAVSNEISKEDMEIFQKLEMIGELSEQFSNANRNDQQKTKDKYGKIIVLNMNARGEEYKGKINFAAISPNVSHLTAGIYENLQNLYTGESGLVLGVLQILEDAKHQEKDQKIIEQLDTVIMNITKWTKNLHEFTDEQYFNVQSVLKNLKEETNNSYIAVAHASFGNLDQFRRDFIFDLAKRSDDKRLFILELLSAVESQNQNKGIDFLDKLNSIYEEIEELTADDFLNKKDNILSFFQKQLINVYPADASLIVVARDLFKDQDFILAMQQELQRELQQEKQNRQEFQTLQNHQLMEALLSRIPLKRVMKEVEILFPIKNIQSTLEDQDERIKVKEEIELIDTDRIKRNSFNREFFKFQMENAYQIWDWQLDLKIPTLPPHQSSSDHTNLNRENIIRERASEVNIATIQFSQEFIKNIKRMIETTDWKITKLKILNTQFGGSTITIGQQDGHAITKSVPHNIAKIYEEILQAEKDKNWIKHFDQIVKLGVKASKPHFIDFFGLSKRDDTTQHFYDLFNELAVQKTRIDTVRTPTTRIKPS